MVQYILECIAFQLAFLVIYDFFLKKETFFQWNRVYLIGTYMLSLVLPWIKIEALKTSVSEQYIVYPEFLSIMNGVGVTATVQASPAFQLSWQEGVLYGGMVLAAIYFGYKLVQLFTLRRNGGVKRFPNFTRIVITNSELAFSFFRSIFLGDKILEREHSSIIKHELVHIEQRHTLDLLFFELMRIVGWFNPLVYVYQNRIAELHEFIADAQVPKAELKAHYDLLLSQIFQTQHISFVNQFFKSSLIKKRIVMLQKSKSKNVFQLKYLLLVPMLVGMLVYTSCEKEAKLTDDTELSSEDEALIARIKNKLKKFETNIGKLFSLRQSQNNSTSDYIMTKEEFFEDEILFGLIMKGIEKELLKKNSKIGSDNIKTEPPSTSRYISYVNRKKAFRLLDPNLKISIRAFKQGVSLIDKSHEYPIGAIEFVVVNSKDLTGDEVRRFNLLIERLENDTATYPGIIIKDDNYAFLVNGNSEYGLETIIETKRTDEDTITVPFAVIDEVPVFPGCENATDKRACFNEKIQKHISKNFNYPQAAQDAGIQGRVNVMFIIQEDGSIGNMKLRGPDKLLEDEVERIISRLPTMTPGKQKGTVVAVPFSIPVTFKLQ